MGFPLLIWKGSGGSPRVSGFFRHSADMLAVVSFLRKPHISPRGGHRGKRFELTLLKMANRRNETSPHSRRPAEAAAF